MVDVVVIVSSMDAFSLAIAGYSSTSYVDHISLLGCSDVVCMWQCRSHLNLTSFLRVLLVDAIAIILFINSFVFSLILLAVDIIVSMFHSRIRP